MGVAASEQVAHSLSPYIKSLDSKKTPLSHPLASCSLYLTFSFFFRIFSFLDICVKG